MKRITQDILWRGREVKRGEERRRETLTWKNQRRA